MEGLMGEYTNLALYPEVTRTLQALKTRKAILSNGSPDILLPLVQNSGLKLDAVISVDELKIFKPAPQVYQLAVKKLQTKDIGFVSSNCWGRLRRKVVRLRRVLDQSRERADRPPGVQAGPHLKGLDEILL
jgi:2-haloalkanoic acid dehalogenase type II